MTKTAFLSGFIIITANLWGMNNSSAPSGSSQFNANRRIIPAISFIVNNSGYSRFGYRNALVTPPNSPYRRDIDISYPSAPPRNMQNQNFFGQRMRNSYNATNRMIVMPQQQDARAVTTQLPQSNITPAQQQALNRHEDRTTVRRVLRTRIDFFVTTYVETAQPISQHIGTYTDNSVRNFTNPQPQNELLRNSTNQNDNNSEDGWLNNLYNSMMHTSPERDSSKGSTLKAENEDEAADDKYDDVPLSQTKSLRKRKASSIDEPGFQNKKKKS